MIKICYRNLYSLSSAKNIECSFEIEEGHPPFVADERALKQILVNVLSNSIKFTQGGGRVITSVTSNEEYAIVKISDNGKGIPKEDVKSIFDPFSRVENDPEVAQEGNGLGLAIVFSLVNLHGGFVTMDSIIDEGTTVTINLPHA